jgi:predicted DNA-binding antitoxin AbrB/MazE fold protein
MSRGLDTTVAIEAVFEKGCFRPLMPLPLEEGVQVRLRLELSRSEDTLAALDDLVAACSELYEEQWRTFDEATARRRST